MKPHNNQHGFTLLELMVALALSGALMAVVFGTMLNIQRSWSVSRTQVEDIRNTRAGVSTMIRDVRMAGSGFGGRAVCVAGMSSDFIYALEPKAGVGSDADTLLITAAFQGITTGTTATCNVPGEDIYVEDTSLFQAGDLVVLTDGVFANMFEVTTVLTSQLVCSSLSPYNQPSGHTSWPGGGYLTGSSVCIVDRVQYWVDDSYADPRLMRQVNSDSPVTVSSGVRDLTLNYALVTGEIVSTVTDPSTIASVILRYLPAGNKQLNRMIEAGGQSAPAPDDTLSMRIQPRVL